MAVVALALIVFEVDLVKLFQEEFNCCHFFIASQQPGNLNQIVSEGVPDTQFFIERAILDQISVSWILVLHKICEEVEIFCDRLGEGHERVFNDHLAVNISEKLSYLLLVSVCWNLK